jgi:O-antigen/teichoic acid export membrane protein
MIVGPMLGLAAVGLLDRSGYLSYIPLMLLGAVQARVLFPYYARIQLDIKKTGAMLRKCIYLSGVLDKLMYIPLFILTPCLPRIMGDKWLPAVPLIQIMIAGNMVFGAMSTSLSPMIGGMGKAHWISSLSWLPVVLTYLSLWPLAALFGLKGVACISIIIWLVTFLGVYLVKKTWPQIKMSDVWFKPVGAGLGALTLVSLVESRYQNPSLIWLGAASLMALLAFGSFLWALGPRLLLDEVKFVKANFVK